MDEQILPNGADISPMESAFHKLASSEEWKFLLKYVEEREKIVMQTFKTIKLVDGGLEVAKYQGFLVGMADPLDAVKQCADKVNKIISDANTAKKK